MIPPCGELTLWISRANSCLCRDFLVHYFGYNKKMRSFVGVNIKKNRLKLQKLDIMTKTKTKLLSMAAVAMLAACNSTTPDASYVVTATVPAEFDGATAFLVNFDTGDKVDSVTVENGAAKFSGTVASPALARLIIDGNRLGNMILEGGEITFADRKATGTPLNEMNNSIVGHLQELEQKYNAVPQDSTGDEARELINAEYDAYVDSVFNANLDNVIGYSFFLDKAYSMNLDELNGMLEAHPSLKDYKRVAKLLEAAENKEKTSVGNKFVDFTIKNDSVSQSLSDYVGRGKPVLVDFWASWCGPCIRETKVIKEILAEYGSQGLEVLGVAVWDEPENTLAAIEKHQLPWQQIINAQAVPTDLYGITGIPCIILFGPDGTILSRDKQDAELRADVKAYFDGTLAAK